jgi:uncharacterized membrane protein (DUF373 family)
VPEEKLVRRRTSDIFGIAEDAFYIAIAGALSIAGVIFFGFAVYKFATEAFEASLPITVLELLDNLLLIFIFTEVIHTIRGIVVDRVLSAEPFLIVGIVAAIRRLLVVTAEAKSLLGTPSFMDVVLEISSLMSGCLLLALAIFLLRRAPGGESSPSGEAD